MNPKSQRLLVNLPVSLKLKLGSIGQGARFDQSRDRREHTTFAKRRSQPEKLTGLTETTQSSQIEIGFPHSADSGCTEHDGLTSDNEGRKGIEDQEFHHSDYRGTERTERRGRKVSKSHSYSSNSAG
jgi:hypothetical protein